MSELETKRGTLTDHNLPSLLQAINNAGATGTLLVRNGRYEKKVFFADGDAIFAGSNNPDDRLGEMLLKAGKITMEQLDRSVEVLKETGKKQGAILVELGYLAPKELFWGVKYQVREIILGLFQWDSGEFEFQDEGTRGDEVIKLKMSMANLVYEGVRRIDQWTRMRREMPPLETVVALNPDPFYLFQQIQLDADDQRVLDKVNGKRSLQAIMGAAEMPSFDCLKALYVLWTLKIIREAEAIAEEAEGLDLGAMVRQHEPDTDTEELVAEINRLYENWHDLTHYEVLGIARDASAAAIKGAYYRRSRRFHPDRHFAAADESVKEKLTMLFHLVNEAYRVLSDPAYRSEYDRELKGKEPAGGADHEEATPQERAAAAFQQGVASFKAGKFAETVEAFRTATRLDGGEAKYWSNLALALSKLPDQDKEAEEALLTAMGLEPFKADHFVNLGMLYLKLGKRTRAKTQFEAALTWDPENKRAQKGLRHCTD